MRNARRSIDYWLNWTPPPTAPPPTPDETILEGGEQKESGTFGTFGTCHLGPFLVQRGPYQDPTLWQIDFEQWATANCTFSDRCFSSVSSLYIDFCEWSLRDNRIASMRGTFEVLLVMNGFEVVDGLVAGLIPRAEFIRITREYPILRGKESRAPTTA